MAEIIMKPHLRFSNCNNLCYMGLSTLIRCWCGCVLKSDLSYFKLEDTKTQLKNDIEWHLNMTLKKETKIVRNKLEAKK